MAKNTHKISDNELLERFASGDQSAFRILVNRYKNALYGFLNKFLSDRNLVEDVFQDTFIQLINSLDSFDKSRPLRPWLFTIAANKAKDTLRKRQRRGALSINAAAEGMEMSFDDMLNVITSTDKTPYDDVDKEETARRVRSVIAELPENSREILILAYFNKFSYKHMADILSIPIGTVKSRLHSAVKQFALSWNSSIGSKTL